MATLTPMLGKPKKQAMGAGKPDKMFELESGAYFEEIPIEYIKIEKKFLLRPVEPQNVAMMRESLLEKGATLPIAVKITNDGFPKEYRLVHGVHKTTAWLQNYEQARALYEQALDEAMGEAAKVNPEIKSEMNRWSTIPATVYPKSTPDNICMLEALSENLHRVDLTPKERDELGTRYSQLLDKVFPNRNEVQTTSKGGPGIESDWFKIWYNSDSNMKTQTAYNRWKGWLAHLNKTGQLEKLFKGRYSTKGGVLTIPPGKTTAQEGALFKKWVVAISKKEKAKQQRAEQEQIKQNEIEDRKGRKAELLSAIKEIKKQDSEAFCICLIYELYPSWVRQPSTYKSTMEEFPLVYVPPPKEKDEDEDEDQEDDE